VKVALLQTELHWEQPDANRTSLAQALSALEPTDLVVLPEMFNTGFSMRSEDLAETMEGASVTWLQGLAHRFSTVFCGSAIIEEEGQYFNRLLWVSPEGKVAHYDKRHLFRMANEHEHYTPGQSRLEVELSDGRCCPLVCYDLRFPVFSRNGTHPFDVLIYVANWPAARAHHWSALLAARAIENQCYVIGVNRIGDDGNQVHYNGDSMVLDYEGQSLLHAGQQSGLHYATLDIDALRAYRDRFPAWRDQDGFVLDE
jgi:predicted amidohydrolase